MKKIFFSLIFFALNVGIYAQESIPGLIPRFYSIEAATDLAASVEVAHELATNGEDISLMEPSRHTNIWNPEKNEIVHHQFYLENQRVKFIKTLPSRSGQVRFTIQTIESKEYIVVVSKKVHNFLLRKNILEKLGYQIPGMRWESQLKVEFPSMMEKDLFFEELKDQLLAGIDRWVIENEELDITLQDVLVQNVDSDIYNLALGIMSPEIHRGRRLLRAPYVPLALVDTPESVNLMPWQAGRIILNNLKLYHNQDLSNDYGTSWEDARWVARKLAKLQRNDWEEIVIHAHLPVAVEKLLIEKMVARRNDMLRILDLKDQFEELPFDPSPSWEDKLKDGEIIQEFFPGFASRFSYGDPESPFSSSELGYFALSRSQSLLIDTAIGQMNKYIGTPDQKLFENQIKKIMTKEGPFFSTQAVAIPSFHGSFILSRDIVTGSYLGTNHKVQLVDNFGFSLDGGVLVGVEGLPIPMKVNFNAGVNFQRVYSHVKPIQSLKKAMKEPYKNLFVPFLTKNIANKIDKLSHVSGEEQEQMVQGIIAELKAAIGVGESLIVTDSLVPKLGGDVSLSISQLFFLDENLLKVYAGFMGQRMMLSRFHFYRANENTFHIYQDYGKNLKLMLTLKLKSYIPIIGFNARWTKAEAHTHFYPISLHPRDASVNVLKALRQSLLSLNHTALQDVVTPHRVEHKINENANTLQFLFFKRNKIGSKQHLVAHHAKGGKPKEIVRRYDAVTTGVDYENFATEALNDLIKNILKFDVSIASVPTINPGFTLGGKARNKIYVSEHDGENLTTTFQRLFNGFKVKQSGLKRIMKILNREIGEAIFNPLAYQHTNSILLYQIQLQVQLESSGIKRLLHLPKPSLRFLLVHHAQHALSVESRELFVESFYNDLIKIKRQITLDPENGLRVYHRFLKSFLNTITIKGLEAAVGKENIAYQARVDGFRQGDENGDNPIFSDVLGELPLPLHLSPTQQIIGQWGILEGEMMANWMMERAI